MPADAQPGTGPTGPDRRSSAVPGRVRGAWARRPGDAGAAGMVRRRSPRAVRRRTRGQRHPLRGAAAGTSPAAARWSRLLTQPAQASSAGPRPPLRPRRTTSPRRVGRGRLVSVAFGAGGAQRGLELADAGISLRELHLGSDECDVQPVVVLALLLVSVLAVGEQPGRR